MEWFERILVALLPAIESINDGYGHSVANFVDMANEGLEKCGCENRLVFDEDAEKVSVVRA